MADDRHVADIPELWEAPIPPPAPESNIQQRPKVSLEQLAGILEGIWSSLSRIADTLETMRPEVNVTVPEPNVVIQRESAKAVRVQRNERGLITGMVSEPKKD